MQHFVPDYGEIEHAGLLSGWLSTEHLGWQVHSLGLVRAVNWIAELDFDLFGVVWGEAQNVDGIGGVLHVAAAAGLLS